MQFGRGAGALTGACGVHRSAPCELIGTAVSLPALGLEPSRLVGVGRLQVAPHPGVWAAVASGHHTRRCGGPARD